MLNLPKLIVALALVVTSLSLQAAQWRKASDWLGLPVVTNQGDKVGQVEDFAIDFESGELRYVVVSVGSFLIKDALIAVSPAVLSRDDSQLVIASDNVSSARRFGPDSWPDEADVVADGRTGSNAGSGSNPAQGGGGATAGGGQPVARLPTSGVATISSNRRTATLSAGERRIEDVRSSRQGPTLTPSTTADVSSPAITRVPNGPLPKFGALDENRNGVLSRREIGAWLTQDEGYTDLDLDSSGTVDRFEYDIFSAQRKR